MMKSDFPPLIFLTDEGDCCNSNFTRVGNNCINASIDMMNYDQAKKKCQDMGSQMVEFQSEQELKEVRSEFANCFWSPEKFLPQILDWHMVELKALLDWTS